MRPLVFLLACGCSTTSNDTADGGVDAAVQLADGGPWACPPNPPELGSPCPPPLSCEYENPKPCGNYFQCVIEPQGDFRWASVKHDCDSVPTCTGAQRAIDAGTNCTIGVDLPCDENNNRCDCTSCLDDAGDIAPGNHWVCVALAQTGCPMTRPRIGTRCDQEGLLCDYRACWSHAAEFGPNVRCLGGIWIADDESRCDQQLPRCP